MADEPEYDDEISDAGSDISSTDEFDVDDKENKPKIKIYQDDDDTGSGSDVDDIELDDIDNKNADANDEFDSDAESDTSENDDRNNERKMLSNLVELSDADESDDDDDEDEEDENYLQKLDSSVKTNLISDYHPEIRSHNYDEIDILSRIVRDEQGTIVDPLHRTLPFMTKFERARILGERAKQLNAGAEPMIPIDADVIDGYLIALKELGQKKIPIIVRRPMPNGGSEYWRVKDLDQQ